MRIGLIDADAFCRGKVTFPNLALMKISAWHKSNGDSVQWWQGLLTGHFDKVYISKVFSDTYSPFVQPSIDADQIIRGGSGYAISLINGKQEYDKSKDTDLSYQIDHIYPDYDLYGIHDTAYGFITKGCPRGCSFCHVARMQGRASRTVASLDEFWRGQKNIVLLDPNITACREWKQHFQKLIDSKAYVNFSQGLDIRMMTPEKWQMLSKIKVKSIHFAWDNPEDDMVPRLQDAKGMIKIDRRKHSVYILTNFNSTFQQDLYRVQTVKSYGFSPYVMIYNKPSAHKQIRQLQRYANNPFIANSVSSFDEYKAKTDSNKRGR